MVSIARNEIPNVGLKPSALAMYTCFALGAGILGYLVELQLAIAILLLGFLFAFSLLKSATSRVILVAFGPFVVFQSSEGVSLPKLAYMLGLAICVLLAASVRPSPTRDRVDYLLGPMYRCSLLGLLVIAGSLIVANSRDVLMGNWGRDIVAYLMLIAVPWICRDACCNLRLSRLQPILVTLGLGSAAFTGYHWGAIRGFWEKGSDWSLLPTALPAYGLLVWAGAKVLLFTSHRLGWSVVIAAITTAMIATGSRGIVVGYAGLLPILLSRRGFRLKNLLMVTVGISLLIVLAFVVVNSVEGMGLVDSARLSSRIELVSGSINDLSEDASFRERWQHSWAALQAFASNPVLGVGPGFTYEVYRPSSNTTIDTLILDTFLGFLSRFGLVGLGLSTVALASILRVGSIIERQCGDSRPLIVLRGWMICTLALFPFMNPFDDKGYSIATAMLVSVVIRYSVENNPLDDSACELGESSQTHSAS